MTGVVVLVGKPVLSFELRGEGGAIWGVRPGVTLSPAFLLGTQEWSNEERLWLAALAPLPLYG